MEAMKRTPEPEISEDIREMEFDEMWHFVESKKTKTGSSRPWVVAQNELSLGLQVIGMFQPLEPFSTKSNT